MLSYGRQRVPDSSIDLSLTAYYILILSSGHEHFILLWLRLTATQHCLLMYRMKLAPHTPSPRPCHILLKLYEYTSGVTSIYESIHTPACQAVKRCDDEYNAGLRPQPKAVRQVPHASPRAPPRAELRCLSFLVVISRRRYTTNSYRASLLD